MVCGFGFELFGVGVASESDCCCLFLPGVVGCGGIARNITLPPNSSENSVGLFSSLRRIPSAERSRGASAKAQFTCSTALMGVPTAGSVRVRNHAKPRVGTRGQGIGRGSGAQPGSPLKNALVRR